MYIHEIDQLNERMLAYRDYADTAQHQAFKYADALIEIAVRNGPVRYMREDDDGVIREVDWDPVGSVVGTHYQNYRRPRHADDYITAARALGIL
jgi:hypothetical protein